MNQIPFSVVLAAGGIGSRMKASQPKQYLEIGGKTISRYSFELFLQMPEVTEIVVVCDPDYQKFYETNQSKKVSFALPGLRRQDSVYNGIIKLSHPSLVCIHDAARPLINPKMIRQVVLEASVQGAAVLGVPVKSTIKVCDTNNTILSTPDRSQLWEMQTPQVIQLDLLKKGYAIVQEKNLTVTDDVSMMELINHPVKVVQGCYKNLKITTPEDLMIAEKLLEGYELL